MQEFTKNQENETIHNTGATAKLAELGFNKPRECQTYTMRDDRGVEYGVLYGGYSIGELMAVLPENVAKENGCDKVELKSEENNWVREWYKRLGFNIISEEAVWMRKSLKL